MRETLGDPELCHIPKNVLTAVDQFRRKQKKGCIDLWWLYDDGGLTLLLPYLLTTRKQWSDCKLRVFALATNEHELDFEKRNLASLLSKFRINYSDVTIIPDPIKPPNEVSLKSFDQIISKWIIRDSDNKTGLNNNTGNNEKSNPAFGITETEILSLKEKVKFAENNFPTNLLIYIIFRLIVT
jgi:solute carrier family 12 sodium/potassium/chloride transporter 2